MMFLEQVQISSLWLLEDVKCYWRAGAIVEKGRVLACGKSMKGWDICRYLNALQTTAQHLLRYLAAAVVVNKRRRNVMKDLIRVIEQESYEYSDPITQFLECLFVRYDFEGAQVLIPYVRECILKPYLLLDAYASANPSERLPSIAGIK